MKGETSELRQWIACLAGALCVSSSAAGFSWVAPLLVSFNSPDSPIPMTYDDSSWISALVELGAFIMSIPAAKLADKFGRKTVLLSTGPINLLAWVIVITTRSVICLFIVRIIQGFAVAIVFTVAPSYLAEIAEPKMRGKLCGLLQSGWLFGCLYTYIAGSYLSYNFYASSCASLVLISAILMYLVPESPYHLLMLKKEQQSREALLWLQHSQKFDDEFLAIKEAVDKDMERKSNWKDLFATKRDIKAFCLVQLICLIRNSNGCTSLQIYVSQTFEYNLDFKLGSNELSIIFGTVLVVATAFASLLTDRIGRRILLIVSTTGGVLFNLIIAIIYFLDDPAGINVSQYKWITFVLIIGYLVISNIGVGPIMHAVQAEYFPTHNRSIGGGVTQTIGAIAAGISIKQYALLDDYFGSYMNFLFFGLICLIGVILIIKLIPETSGKSLSEVQECFN